MYAIDDEEDQKRLKAELAKKPPKNNYGNGSKSNANVDTLAARKNPIFNCAYPEKQQQYRQHGYTNNNANPTMFRSLPKNKQITSIHTIASYRSHVASHPQPARSAPRQPQAPVAENRERLSTLPYAQPKKNYLAEQASMSSMQQSNNSGSNMSTSTLDSVVILEGSNIGSSALYSEERQSNASSQLYAYEYSAAKGKQADTYADHETEELDDEGRLYIVMYFTHLIL
jgi:hypothetical protein